jgi:uncharacterized protein YggL (DUF469 family)
MFLTCDSTYVLRRDAPFSDDERAPDDRGAMSAPCPILGFTVLVDLHESVGEPQAEALTQSLTELAATQGLVASGGGRRQLLFVVSREGSQATEAERQLVEGWAAEWADVAAITVSDLVDLSPGS